MYFKFLPVKFLLMFSYFYVFRFKWLGHRAGSSKRRAWQPKCPEMSTRQSIHTDNSKVAGTFGPIITVHILPEGSGDSRCSKLILCKNSDFGISIHLGEKFWPKGVHFNQNFVNAYLSGPKKCQKCMYPMPGEILICLFRPDIFSL